MPKESDKIAEVRENLKLKLRGIGAEGLGEVIEQLIDAKIADHLVRPKMVNRR